MNKDDMKVAIIAIAKNENLYINEWLDYHFNLGFDNVIVCDNDDELIIKDVVHDDRVIIEDYTKIKGVQQTAYQETLKKYKENFDWILFIDIDEFLVLEKHNNVKEFIKSFDNDVGCIKLCWKHFTDNNELDVIDGNYNVFDRFKNEIKTKIDCWTKQFVKTSIFKDDKTISKLHQHEILDYSIKTVNALNVECEKCRTLKKVIHEVAWINHYRTKTIGEYIRQKYFRGGPNFNNVKYKNLRYFWETNEETLEKKAYAEKLITEYNNKN